MTTMSADQSNLPHRSVWQHKRRPITAVVNHVLGDDVQVLNDRRTHLRWLSVKGFVRDYVPTGRFETVTETLPLRDVSAHDGGRVGCNHAGGRCSELDADDVGHDLYSECSRPACECHRLIRD
ncbi:hypothetical protein [Curtobacterium sp. MCBD17_040]|uniref:hypothetical protein n=1 Tax=Curtobacterium sp. MCBD17_040 TaxID=2175674 RepID=UPI0011B49296|nr:hypothetical protein [Curtobacterium sp. MCBD17_040]WIB65882.1 hypothetical protein DEI94_17355 [Curtobacterium sp. MCBD17_040]